MVYEFIPSILIGIVLLVVGIRLTGNAPIVTLAKLALIVIGLIALGWGIFAGWAELTTGL